MYICNSCSAVFETTEDIFKHKEKCTKDNPYIDDDNAVDYNDELTQ